MSDTITNIDCYIMCNVYKGYNQYWVPASHARNSPSSRYSWGDITPVPSHWQKLNTLVVTSQNWRIISIQIILTDSSLSHQFPIFPYLGSLKALLLLPSNFLKVYHKCKNWSTTITIYYQSNSYFGHIQVHPNTCIHVFRTILTREQLVNRSLKQASRCCLKDCLLNFTHQFQWN